METSRWLLGFAGLSLAFACGSRSDLQATSVSGAGAAGGTSAISSSAGGGGAGGSTTSTSSTSTSSTSTSSTSTSSGAGGSGGTGGGPVVACDGVELAMPILDIEQPSGDSTLPGLVALETTPPTVGVVFAKQDLPPVTGPVVQTGVLDAWGAWPPATPMTAGVKITGSNDPQVPNGPVAGVSFLAASRHASPPSSFALLFRDFGGIRTNLVRTVGTGGDVNDFVFQTEPGDALMLAPDGAKQQFLGGVGVKHGGNFGLDMMVTNPNGEKNSFSVGCATTPIAADAVPRQSGWLLGAAVGTKIAWSTGGDCLQKFGMIGPATELSFANVDASGDTANVTAVIQTPGPVARVRMAPRSDGAWVVWGLEVSSSLSGARLSTLPMPIGSFQLVPQISSLVTTSFDVKPLGDTLVVAAVDRGSGDDHIQLTALDGDGAAKWAKSFLAAGKVDGALSLLAAPDGSALLVAWSEHPVGKMIHRVRVARLDCLTKP